MSGHDFEKQVRQKLNDLKMTPSAGAWENIEGRLRERKRRPVVFYWLPLLLVGLAAGGYLFLNNDHKTVLSDKNSTSNVSVQPKSVPGTNPGTVIPSAPQPKTAGGRENTRTSRVSSPERNIREDFLGKFSSSNDKNDVEEANNNHAPASLLNPDRQEELNVPDEKTAEGKGISLKISNYPIGTITPSPLNFLQPPPKSAAKKLNKWSYGLSAFAGISAVSEGHLLNFNNAQVEDVSRVPSFAPRPSYKPSSISPGVAYSAGLFVKRELNSRFSLSVGANYLQLNTRNKVGDQEYGNQIVNAGASGFQAVTNYFRVERDRISEYHNRYHFIEVPVELHTRLNKSAKVPIQLTTGVAVSQLLKSTSLHFDGTTGVYYKNDRLLNQTQVAAKAGISVGILNKTTRPLWIGPSAKYNVSKILEKDVSARTNFMSIGVDVKIFIK
jgi:hypothetical protein